MLGEHTPHVYVNLKIEADKDNPGDIGEIKVLCIDVNEISNYLIDLSYKNEGWYPTVIKRNPFEKENKFEEFYDNEAE